MTAVSLKEVLPDALSKGYAIPGFVVLGWEDAIAFVEASEETNCPVIIQAGPACRRHTPIPILAKMFRYLADQAKTKIVCHLDHATNERECEIAIDEGFTSIMYDGSNLNLEDNIHKTLNICELAKRHNISVEAELGFVGYSESENSNLTNPTEVKIFVDQTNVDALAVSVGNMHLQNSQKGSINTKVLDAIQKNTSCPLVLHGASGIPNELRKELGLNTSVCKFNIGTELRLEFGKSIRNILKDNQTEFDRINILSKIIAPMKEKAKKIILNLRP